MANKNLYPLLITTIVLGALLIAGNASAFSVNIKPDNNKTTAGETINFHVTIDGAQGNVSLLTLVINGPINKTCTFDANGHVIGVCEGVKVKRLGKGEDDEEFGYGYNKHNLKYKISLESDKFKAGTYNIQLTVNSDLGSASGTASVTLKDKKKDNGEKENGNDGGKDNENKSNGKSDDNKNNGKNNNSSNNGNKDDGKGSNGNNGNSNDNKNKGKSDDGKGNKGKDK